MYYNRVRWYDTSTGRIVIDSSEGIFHSSDNTIPLFPLFTFHGGFRRIRTSNGKSGFIGKSGEIIIDPTFDWASSFSEGLSAVRIKGQWGYINSVGEMVIKPRFEHSPGSFSEGLAYVVLGDKYGYIDKKNNFKNREKVLENKYITA